MPEIFVKFLHIKVLQKEKNIKGSEEKERKSSRRGPWEKKKHFGISKKKKIEDDAQQIRSILDNSLSRTILEQWSSFVIRQSMIKLQELQTFENSPSVIQLWGEKFSHKAQNH